MANVSLSNDKCDKQISATFNNIVFKCNCDIGVSTFDGGIIFESGNDIKIERSRDNKTLFVTGRTSNNFNIGNISFGGSNINIGSCNGISISNGVVSMSTNTPLIINGVLVDINELQKSSKSSTNIQTKDKDDDKFSRNWKIYTTSKANNVECDNTTVTFYNNIFTNTPTFNNTGSSSTYFSKFKFDSFNLSITGVGDVDCGSSIIGNMCVKIYGTGNITNFSVVNSGDFSIYGTGNIDGLAVRGCDIDRTVHGTGNINIARITNV